MKPKKKKFTLNIKTMGVNIDKNEYREIVLSNSSHPEANLNGIKAKPPQKGGLQN